MEKMVKVTNSSYAKYEELLLYRDQLEREAANILATYKKEFGELEIKIFETKTECIKIKKSIVFCQTDENRDQKPDTFMLNEYLDKNMDLYYAQLRQMEAENNNVRKTRTVPAADIEESKKLYCKLAKQLHPEINPVIRENKSLQDIWKRIVTAYRQSDTGALAKLEEQADNLIRGLDMGIMEIEIPDIEEHIISLKEEINKILTTKPYTYIKYLKEEGAIENKKEELNKELKEYQMYQDDMEKLFRKMITEGNLNIIWETK